jgi:diguanylate cyclase (GGDEF)-like protein
MRAELDIPELHRDGQPPSRPTRPPSSLQRRLLLFAAAILGPVLAGALISGVVLLYSASSSNRLAEDVVTESTTSVALFRDLEAARLAGSSYMEEGERADLREFLRARRAVTRGLASPVYDEPYQRSRLRRVTRDWEAAVRQLRGTRTGISVPSDDATDPEDVFEDHVNSAIIGVEGLVEAAEQTIRDDLSVARDLQRTQALVAFVALLASLAIAALLVRRLARAMLRPIHRLTRAARAFGSGHLGQRVAVNSSAELHEMAETFNRMAGALQEQHGQLEHQAFTDSLTDVANRALFEDRTRHALERSTRTSERVAVLVLDLDDFKLINDGLGHSVGDELLVQAAARMDAAVRPSDTVARLGGDEFAVLLESVRGLDDALGAAERLREAFDTPIRLNDSDLVITASVGIAMSGDSIDGEELLRRADLAMYRVKGRGKDGTALFDPDTDDRGIDRLEVLNALRKAVHSDQLVAHYQPIVDLDSGEVVAAEALVRWDRPGYGLVPPLEFIPLAEETGIIHPLGAWILKEACTSAREWRLQGAPDVSVAVNVSARQLIDPDFERLVAVTLAETELEPEGLVLEVTESSVMQNAELTIAKLGRITESGVQLSLDDFGEGYSSLSHLRRLPVGGLKIARPFVQELGSPTGDPAMVRGIIELAHSLGLGLVAEGIERPEQRDALLELGCTRGQGFLFARPLELPALRGLLHEQRRATAVA